MKGGALHQACHDVPLMARLRLGIASRCEPLGLLRRKLRSRIPVDRSFLEGGVICFGHQEPLCSVPRKHGPRETSRLGKQVRVQLF